LPNAPRTATRARARAGTLTLVRGEQQWPATLAGDLPAARPDDLLLVADIAWVQERFGPVDAVSEGRVRLAPDSDLASWRKKWAQQLPAGLLIRVADDDSARVSNLSRAYRVNLNVLALVALLTGAFLVFATQLTSVAQRSTQFALLGVLGLSPRMRLLQVLLEGLAIGVPGALLGLGLGYALAVAFTRLLGGDLGGGYFAGSAPLIIPLPAPALVFLALGCLASLAGASYPAYLNRMQPLAQALKTGFAQQSHADTARAQTAAAAPAPAAWRWPRSRAGATAAAVRTAARRLCGDCPGAGRRHRQRTTADATDFRLAQRASPCRRRNASRCRMSRRRH
jgi:putative ABC transport system permease protein